MQRGPIGHYQTTIAGGEEIRAFLPLDPPPNPPVEWTGDLVQLLSEATIALGRLDGISHLLPDKGIFLYSYVRKEALLSSQIEGTQSSLSDLLLFELAEAPGALVDDVTEVSNYVAALEHGLARLKEGFPLSNRLIREIHSILFRSGSDSAKSPGEFRRSQNWIGGSRPGNAVYVPPPHTEVGNCMANLEQFLHADNDGLPPLVRAGLAHVQFETIHPFLDGNGRVGRLLISLFLCHSGVLQDPILYLSLFLKRRRAQYYDLLEEVRETGDWESWLSFFLEGVRQSAEDAVGTVRRLTGLFDSDRDRLLTRDGRRANAPYRVLESVISRPITSISDVCERTGLSTSGASSAMATLLELGIAREITGRRRNRIFVYQEYLSILNEGTEPL